MIKKWILAVIAVFVAWSILDYLIHGVLLKSAYEATASLWRPMAEMKFGLMYVVTAVFVCCFVGIYTWLCAKKTFCRGVAFGALFGIAMGMSVGFGSYTSMPIPLSLAWAWFIGTFVEALVAGAIVGAIVRPPKTAA